jgi:hypothetical protein
MKYQVSEGMIDDTKGKTLREYQDDEGWWNWHMAKKNFTTRLMFVYL